MSGGVVPESVLRALRELTTPTICNAIETFNARDRSEGFMGPEVKCLSPELPAMVGYACTALIGARTPDGPKRRVTMQELWDHVETIPEPRVVVVADIDAPRPMGSFWGEVNANIFKAQGCIGTVTSGGVRDLDEVRALGFHYFATEVLVSHANLHLIDVGLPVRVGGLLVHPGDLLHGDKHGVTSIPSDIAAEVPEAAKRVDERERRIIDYCKSPGFSREGLWSVLTGRSA